GGGGATCTTISFTMNPFPEDWRIVHITTSQDRTAKEVKIAKGTDNSIPICYSGDAYQNLLAFVPGAPHDNQTVAAFSFQIYPPGAAPPPQSIPPTQAAAPPQPQPTPQSQP